MCHPITTLITYKTRACGYAAALLLAGTAGLSAIQVNLAPDSRVYDGTPQLPAVTTIPAGLPVELTYRSLSQTAVAESTIVFDNTPATLGPSYSSVSFSSNQMSGIGNYLQLGGTSRQIQSIEVAMVTWAAAADHPLLAAINPAGYTHPVTLSLYQLTESNQLVFLTEVMKQVLVPWRPQTLPDGSPYPYNGYAFSAVFDFSGTAALPEKVMALVSYDTSRSGFTPVGLPGPYDQLNVAVTTALSSIGADADPGKLFKVVSDPLVSVGRWEYPDTSLGTRSPMMRVRTLSTRSKTAPRNAGSYEVYATLSGTTYPGAVLGNFTIDKAPAVISGLDRQAFYTGGAIGASVTTQPAGLSVNLLYDGSPAAPVAIGSYQITAEVADANYNGHASGLLTINPSGRSWLDQQVASGAIPAGLAGFQDDPDGDGVTNLMEYAANSDPSTGLLSDANGPLLPRLLGKSIDRKFIYRKNLDAGDLDYQVECAAAFGSNTWAPVSGNEKVLSDDGHTQVVELALPAEEAGCQFYRLKVSR